MQTAFERALRIRNSSVLSALIGSLVATTALAGADHDRSHDRSSHVRPDIDTLSTSPDLVSGGDVLVRVAIPAGAKPAVRLNGRDVSADFRVDPDGRAMTALLTGLRLGKNVLSASSAMGRGSSSLTITNHSISGPLFSGPHQQPFLCETETFNLPVIGGTLGVPLDANCSIATRVDYLYRATDGTFKPLADPRVLPLDVVRTMTSLGRLANYVVRLETGTINRAIYQIAVLHDPSTESALPAAPSKPASWNGRLIYSYGSGMASGYHQGRTTGNVVNDAWLSLGYAVAGASLSAFGNNNNDVLSAETTMMVKERFVERFGPPVHTIGWGTSGGSMQQHLIAHNYPGLLDGITPGSSFSDALILGITTSDCPLISRAINGSTQPWTAEQRIAVAGWGTLEHCPTQFSGDWGTIFKATRSPPPTFAGCNAALPPGVIYDPVTNPQGARCTYQDNSVNIFGIDPQTGYAPTLLDNVGVQYGLAAFDDGTITAEQFVQLNERAGGFDGDGNLAQKRSVADRDALRTAYSTGRVNSGGGGLASIPIIDYRLYRDDIADPHDSIRSHSTRARLIAANGHANNQIILVGSRVGTGAGSSAAVNAEVLRLMDQWLTNIGSDGSNLTRAAKVVRNRPAAAVDACFTVTGEKITDQNACRQLYPLHRNARLVAGEPLANNILKCQLKPLSSQAYKHPLTTDQLTRLMAVFPDGVCDYRRPGVGQNVPLKDTWLAYPEPGRVMRLEPN